MRRGRASGSGRPCRSGAGRPAEALAFAAHDDHDRAAQVGLTGRQRSVGVRADDPQASDVQVGQGLGQVFDRHEQQVLDGAGRGLDGGRRERRLAADRVDDAVDARGLGRSQQRAEVLRILERIEHEDERRLGPLDRSGQDVVEAGELAAIGDQGDPLVAVEAGQRGQRPAFDLDDRDAQVGGVQDELLERLAALRDDEQADRLAVGDERLLDRVAAGDELLVLAEQVARRRTDRSSSPRRRGRAAGTERPAIDEAARTRAIVGSRRRRASNALERPVASLGGRRFGPRLASPDSTPSGPV